MHQNPETALFTLDHLVEQTSVAGHDERPALVLRDEVLSHKELRHRVARLAGWLKSRVPQEASRVATWAAKGELTCLMPLAAARAGLIHVPINPLLKHAQASHILADSGAAMVIGTKARIESLPEDLGSQNCVRVEEKDALEAAAKLDHKLAASQADPETLAAILYTSGSTGRPKGVMLSHANLWLGALSVAR